MSKKRQLISLFGTAVSDEPGLLAQFSSPIAPQYVVRLSNAEQIETLVRWARKTSTPLVPVSSCGRHYHGGTMPSVPECVIADMRGMKQIISINRQFRIAAVQPGVTYADLLPELEKEGLVLPMPLAPKAGKSVAASLLDIEPRLDPSSLFNSMDPLRCTEVIWGDGQRMGTGEANGADIETQQAQHKWQINPRGPALIDYYRLLTASQGTMGIVSWVSMHCSLKPSRHEMFIVPALDAASLVDFVYKVTRFRFGREILIVNSAELAALLSEDDAGARALMAALPPWAALVGISAGDVLPEQKFAQQKDDIEDFARQFSLELLPAYGPVSGKDILERISRPCPEGRYWKELRKGFFKDIFFVTTLDRADKYIRIMREHAARCGIADSDIGVYIQPMHQGVNVQLEFTVFYDADSFSNAERLFTEASAALCLAGAFFHRPYGHWARLQLQRDAQTLNMQRTLKKIFDPDGIMNPGKMSDF